VAGFPWGSRYQHAALGAAQRYCHDPQISIENVRCGDVVLFRAKIASSSPHCQEARVAECFPTFLQRRRHPTSDGVVQEQELLGRVMRIYRGGRRIDLDAPRQLALGLFISQLSLHSRFWYPLAKFAAVVTRPVRRMMNALHASNAAVR